MGAAVVPVGEALAARFEETAVAAGVDGAGGGGVTAATVAGEIAGEAPAVGLLAAGAELGAPEAAGLAAGAASSFSTGALFPMFTRSGPNLILPSMTGRSKR